MKGNGCRSLIQYAFHQAFDEENGNVEKRNALKTGYDQHSGSVQHLSDRSPIYQLSQILRFGRAAHLFVCQQT